MTDLQGAFALDDLDAGTRLRDAGMREALTHLPAAVLNALIRHLVMLADTGTPFSADDATDRLTDGERETLAAFPNAIGAVIHHLARLGTIERAGYTRSRQPSRRHGVVALWRGSAT